VRTQLAGSYASAFPGPGVEFLALRPYVPGDAPRHIDWRVTARRRRPYVRRYVEERELRVLIALDVSRSMGSPQERTGTRERAATVVAALSMAAAQNGDQVGLLTFGAEVEGAVPPRRGVRHALELVRRALADVAPGPRTDIRPVLGALRRLHGHAVVFLVSDFAIDPPLEDVEVRRQLAACAHKHELLAVHLPGEEPPAIPALLAVSDAESGRAGWLDGSRGDAAASARRAAAVRAALLRCGVPSAQVEPGGDVARELLRLFSGLRAGAARR
jgi:uncharacterized protein (DUF58 family)